MTRVRLAVLVAVVGLTSWNWLQFQQRVSDSYAALDHALTLLRKPPQEKRERLSRVGPEIAPIYEQREVLIITLGLAVWLLTPRLTTSKRP